MAIRATIYPTGSPKFPFSYQSEKPENVAEAVKAVFDFDKIQGGKILEKAIMTAISEIADGKAERASYFGAIYLTLDET